MNSNDKRDYCSITYAATSYSTTLESPKNFKCYSSFTFFLSAPDDPKDPLRFVQVFLQWQAEDFVRTFYHPSILSYDCVHLYARAQHHVPSAYYTTLLGSNIIFVIAAPVDKCVACLYVIS